MLTVVIAAAGSGERLGAGGPKAFVEVAGRPLLAWSVAAAAASDAVGTVVIATPPGDEARARQVAAEAAAGAELAIVVTAGGASRAESVRLAVDQIDGDGIVAIHDAARPLVTAAMFDAVAAALAAAPEAAGAIAATPLTDTIKRAATGTGETIAATLERAGLWAAETPQAFRLDPLRAAQRGASEDGSLDQATDEAWLLERTSGAVLLVDCGEPNLKLTTAADLSLAEAILERRRGV